MILSRFSRRMKMRDKIILFFLAIFIIWTSIFIFYFYSESNQILQTHIESAAVETLEQAHINILYWMKEMNNVSDSIYLNEDLQRIISRSMTNETLKEQINAYFEMKPFFINLSKGYELYQVKLYIQSDILYSKENSFFYDENDIEDLGWYNDAIQKNGGTVWLGNVQDKDRNGDIYNKISLAREFKDFVNQKKLGILRVDINEKEMQQILDKTNTINKGDTYLVDDNGVIISSKSIKKGGEKIDQGIVSKISKETGKGSFQYVESDSLKLIVYQKLENSDWVLISIIPYNVLSNNYASLRNSSILVMLIMLVVSIALVYMFSRSFTKRINNLSHKMANIENHNFSEHVEVLYNDEFSRIEGKYNEMIVRIRKLISEIYEAEVKKKGAELKALQAQINPHFLYNTLDNINWMAMDVGAYNISSIITSLGKFYRKCLNNGKEVVSIRDEIELTKLYLQIQQMRLKNFLEIEYDIPDQILQYSTVKLLLQPIVENSIKHGIQPNIGRKAGKITIRGEMLNGRIQMQIIDNGESPGVGNIPVDHVLNMSDFKSGYGLSNVRERLLIYFGEQCELTLAYNKETGCVVQIEWPAILYNEEA